MKIALLNNLYESIPPHSKNGLEFLLFYLAEELVKQGHSPILFSTADSVVPGAELVKLIPHGYSFDEISHEVQIMYWEFIASLYATDYVNKHKDIDILHLNYLFPEILSNFCEKPIVRTYHHSIMSAPFNNMHKFYTGEYAEYGKKMYSDIKGIYHVFVSERQKELAAEYYKGIMLINEFNSRVIYNGIPVEDFQFNPTPSDFYLYFGFLTPDKGADEAVQIAKQAGIKLKISGVYDTRESFFDEKIKPFLDDKIEFIGPVPWQERGKLLGSAKAMLFPLRWEEPFGLTVIESMASGTPVIAYNKGAMPEIIQDGINGFVAKDQEEFINDIFKIETISRETCRESVKMRFSVEKMTKEYLNLYQSLSPK